MKIKLFEAFSGIGSQTQALKNLGVEHEVVGISEIDKHAIQSYELLHGKVNNYGDISKINGKEIPQDIDIFTYSFPCQDLSNEGNKNGIKIGTRSGLLYEVERVLKEMENKPKILLLENVKNLVSKRHKNDFLTWLTELEAMGYTNTWSVLNAKDYGIPQNRERVFVVSRLDNKEYNFPEPIKLKYKLKDFLENEIGNEYNLTDTLKQSLILKKMNDMFLIKNSTKKGYLEARDGDGIDLSFPNSENRRGRVQINKIQTIKTSANLGVIENSTIRKLTPRECWRLMGFKDEQFDKVDGKISNNQLYKQAGNSIVVDVLMGIFREL